MRLPNGGLQVVAMTSPGCQPLNIGEVPDLVPGWGSPSAERCIQRSGVQLCHQWAVTPPLTLLGSAPNTRLSTPFFFPGLAIL